MGILGFGWLHISSTRPTRWIGPQTPSSAEGDEPASRSFHLPSFCQNLLNHFHHLPLTSTTLHKVTEQWSPALYLPSICMACRIFPHCTAPIWRVIRVPLLRNLVNINLLNELMTELFSLSGQHSLSLGLYQIYYGNSGNDDYLFQAHIRRLHSLDDLLSVTRPVIYGWGSAVATSLPFVVCRSNKYKTFFGTQILQTSKSSEFSNPMDNLAQTLGNAGRCWAQQSESPFFKRQDSNQCKYSKFQVIETISHSCQEICKFTLMYRWWNRA